MVPHFLSECPHARRPNAYLLIAKLFEEGNVAYVGNGREYTCNQEDYEGNLQLSSKTGNRGEGWSFLGRKDADGHDKIERGGKHFTPTEARAMGMQSVMIAETGIAFILCNDTERSKSTWNSKTTTRSLGAATAYFEEVYHPPTILYKKRSIGHLGHPGRGPHHRGYRGGGGRCCRILVLL